MKQSSETLATLSTVNEAFIKPLPNSSKVFVKGSRDDILVPMRQIKLTDTIGDLAEKNEPVHVYDTSGPYTDPPNQLTLEMALNLFELSGLKNEVTRKYLMVLVQVIVMSALKTRNLMI